MRIKTGPAHVLLFISFKRFSLLLVFLSFMVFHADMARSGESEVVNLVREGHKLFMADDLAGAETKCREALRINARYFPAYNLLGGIYSVQPGKEKNGIMYFTKSLEVNPAQETIYVKLGFLYNKQGAFDESIEVLKKGLVRYPGDYYINYNLGLIYMLERKDPRKALEHLKVSEKSEKVDTKLIYVEGVAYMFLKDQAKSIDMVTRLRKGGDEYLATHLEDMIRRSGRGDEINPLEIARVFNRQSGTRVVGGASSEAGLEEPKAAGSPRPAHTQSKTRIKARGTPTKPAGAN